MISCKLLTQIVAHQLSLIATCVPADGDYLNQDAALNESASTAEPAAEQSLEVRTAFPRLFRHAQISELHW